MLKSLQQIMLLVFLVSQESCLAEGTSVKATELKDYLFQDYYPMLMPRCQLDNRVMVYLDMSLRQVINLDEKDQVLSTNIWIRIGWYDCRLEWKNESAFKDIDRIAVIYRQIWTPDLAIYDSCSAGPMMPRRQQFHSVVYPSGYTQSNFPTILKSGCRFIGTYFPFDTQVCYLDFGSWSHSMADIDMKIVNDYADLGSFTGSTEWDIDELPGKRCEQTFVIGNFSKIRFQLVMQRRPAFYIMTMLLPCLLVSFTASIAFILPVESGDKVGLEVTVLLSLIVSLLVLTEILPPCSDSFPLIGSYFTASMVLVCLSLIMAITVVNVHYGGASGTGVPQWTKQICINKQFGRCLMQLKCCNKQKFQWERKKKRHSHHDVSTADEEDNTATRSSCLTNRDSYFPHKETCMVTNLPVNSANRLEQQIPKIASAVKERGVFLEQLIDTANRMSQHENINMEWRDIATLLDKVLLILYSVASLTVLIVILVQIASQKTSEVMDVCEFEF